MSGWTHAICLPCWHARNPGREPVRMTRPQPETCCFCGQPTTSGIYARCSPDLIPHCAGHEDDD